ncbi:TlyA family RNA methyltransferase [Humibacillus xanthopallidus]|uniref:23S rRNA (Cytidine1920-2'-O)/16S rRNA (Cytidine1409-2'-O)-methyltransferase n=1 Tax=Humibacillus xanthopallidus TaxID=412689 RepID=A0A543HJ75_9MICO|nr:TlyA family RNA methyltransferase [Humibacillus xanthopallidus]TQM58374.1 23S rRNA (cytidine1920-2'-O)/16S rRNA (cytidine1409-2'-O)-methyltransferase [Humibacillus xanthopallidus]
MTARRLDAELVARGLARSRGQARELVDAGVVLVDGRPAAKPAQPVGPEDAIVLTRPPEKWVGRAAFKLLHALQTWPIAVEGRRCVDVGASTGGFTQVLLEHGAAHVTALDVGHDQLAAEVAADPRVTDLSGTNVRDVDVTALGGPFDVVVADLSFISLTVVLAPLRALVREDGDLVVLVKPQFEVGRERLSRTGVVTSVHERRRVLRAVVDVALGLGLQLEGAVASPIAGGEGNREFLLWLRPAGPGDAPSDPDDMLGAIDLEGDP